MKLFITKYALTTGVEEAETEIDEDCPELVIWGLDGYHLTAYGEGKEWHRTREGANARAEQMRLAKIASLQKQINRLEGFSFTKKI